MLVLVLVVLVVVGGIMKPIMTFLRPKRHRWRDERRRRPYAHIAERRARRRQMYRARSMLLSILILVIIIVIEVFFIFVFIVVFIIIIAGITPSFGTQPRRRRRRIGVPVLRLRAAPDRVLRLCSGTRGGHGAARAELEVVVPVLLWCGAWGRGDASACLIRVQRADGRGIRERGSR